MWSVKLLVVGALGLLGAASIEAADGVSPEAQRGEIVIGSPLPLTGKLSHFGVLMQRSLDMAQHKINAAGGVKGRPLRLVYADDKGRPQSASGVVEQLIGQARASMLVGGYQSDATYAIARLANERDVPFLVCTAATDRITEQRWRNIYRISAPVSEYTASLQDYLLKVLHPKSMAIVYENSMFGTDAAANMMAFLQDNGIEIAGLVGYSAARADGRYLRSLLAPLAAEPPDVIHMISYLSDAVALVKTIRELGIPAQLSGAAAGFAQPKFLAQAGKSADGLLVSTLWSHRASYPGAKGYAEEYLNAYGESPAYQGAESYAGLMVAADALERASSLEAATIRSALDQTFMMTLFGPVKFYSYGPFERQNSVRTQVLQVQDGEYEVVWPPDLATAPETHQEALE